jgi:hypothetical protein
MWSGNTSRLSDRLRKGIEPKDAALERPTALLGPRMWRPLRWDAKLASLESQLENPDGR